MHFRWILKIQRELYKLYFYINSIRSEKRNFTSNLLLFLLLFNLKPLACFYDVYKYGGPRLSSLGHVVSYSHQCYSWGGAMDHIPIQQKNGPLTTEFAILNLERMVH